VIPAALLLASAALAQGAAGLGLGALALHTGSGEHRLAPALSGWGRVALGQACHAEAELGLARHAEGGPTVPFDERWTRGALGVGCSTGTRAARVAASLGPALTWRRTTIDGRWTARALGAGVRWRGGFLVPLGEHGELDVLAGGASRGPVFDFDLTVQGGARW